MSRERKQNISHNFREISLLVFSFKQFFNLEVFNFMPMDLLQLYLQKAGQDFQYLMQGAAQYGYSFIERLAIKAYSENKKIVWKERLINGQDLGLLDYELQPI